jgi:hypothetical protein
MPWYCFGGLLITDIKYLIDGGRFISLISSCMNFDRLSFKFVGIELFIVFLYYHFWWHWDLNSGTHLTHTWRGSCILFLGLVLDLDSPTFPSYISGITEVSYHL